MPYLYETHLHTCQGSACGVSTGREHVRFYKSLGYQGIFVTDHFFGGNTAVDRALPWCERIHAFCAGYEEALDEGLRVGLDVFFGWEQGYGGDEYLIYGLDKQWLLDHPEVERWSRREQYEHVRADGGCVVQAHPFRTRAYIDCVRLGKAFSDGIEVANAGNGQINDAYADRYAHAFGLVMIAGSDNHNSESAAKKSPDNIYGVRLSEPLRDARAFAAHILSGGDIGLHVPEGRFLVPEDDATVIPSYWLEPDETLSPTARDFLRE